ncbi:hypothetical protein AYO47_09000 [Planctomyces sp. SCGC AG-212-M04]|nr:hypothetical protein AYO47_09000 [Planctomyces sp. SCGC AG-212-M04]
MSIYQHDYLTVSRERVSRRAFLRSTSVAAAGAGLFSFSQVCGLHAEELKKQGRSMILLYMAGAPSQFETFDPKPGHENGGETKVIETSIPGVQIADSLPNVAKVLHECALIRSLTNKEGNHQRAQYQLHTGYLPSGGLKHPHFGSAVAKELAIPGSELPAVVSIGRTEGAGFLGVDYEPFVVENPGDMPRNVRAMVPDQRYTRRLGLREELEKEFASRGAEQVVENQRQLYGKASRMVLSPQVSTFDLKDEPADLQAKYGRGNFGRGCLLARRLVEKGVPFVEVRLDGWDTHFDNFERVPQLCQQIDSPMGALITDLKDRGLLEKTVVLWVGEFGRTPKINPRGGRDHYPRVFSALVAGGGIKGGQVIGKSSADGASIDDRPVTVPDLFTSICKALEVNPKKENTSPIGRPIKIVDGGEVVREMFA